MGRRAVDFGILGLTLCLHLFIGLNGLLVLPLGFLDQEFIFQYWPFLSDIYTFVLLGVGVLIS